MFYRLLSEVEEKHWWFRSRLKLILWCLHNQVDPFDNFLEVGCGTGYVLAGIRRDFENASLYGTEFLVEGLSYARQKVPSATLHELDALRMNEYQEYDAIGAFDVIEHIEDDVQVLLNLSRALKRGGSLLVSVPQHKWLWSEADEHAGHARRYSQKELLCKLKESGLEVKYSTSFTSILLPLMYLYRLIYKFKKFDPAGEFLISPTLNWSLQMIMKLERFIIKKDINFPFGGSLIVVARKP